MRIELAGALYKRRQEQTGEILIFSQKYLDMGWGYGIITDGKAEAARFSPAGDTVRRGSWQGYY